MLLRRAHPRPVSIMSNHDQVQRRDDIPLEQLIPIPSGVRVRNDICLWKNRLITMLMR